jgi:hypothetical protein
VAIGGGSSGPIRWSLVSSEGDEVEMARVSTSKRYDVSGQEMWERIGDPGRLYEWHPAIEATEVLSGGKKRVNTLGDGGRVSETILEQAERHHTFRIDQGPLPVENLVSTLRVRDESEGACVVEWEATFDPVGVTEDEAVEFNRGFFQEGLDAL